MHPVLCEIGSISIYTYGFFIAVGFIACIILARYEAGRVGVDPDTVMDLSFYIILSALIGSRFFYVITAPDIFLNDPLEIFRIWNGGLVFYGGFIFALITGIIYLKGKKLDMWKVGDILAPAIPLGQFFGRLGCFFAGCCFGKISDVQWAVVFRDPASLAPLGIPLHPTQLYHALGNLIIFIILWSYRRRKRFQGQLFWMYVTIYGAVRTVLELYRGDFRGKMFFEIFSISQVIGISMFVLGVVMLLILSRKNYSRAL